MTTKTLTASFLMLLALAHGQALVDTGAAAPAPIPYATMQVISNGDSDAVVAEKAAKVLPRANQTDWMRLERTFFLHFCVNTFNHVEWGSGREDPSIFNPKELDANQWLDAMQNFGGNHSVPEYATGFDDSSWNTLKAGSGEGTIKTDNTAAIYRARLTLTEADLSGPGVQVHFTGCDDEGWYFVNGQYVGETHDWDAKPAFDITKFLRAGDNVIAVCCRNGGAQGGLNPNVTVDIIAKPGAFPWSRGLFNGLGQIIVQSTKDAGEIKLTATADGLMLATAAVNTQPSKPRPSVP